MLSGLNGCEGGRTSGMTLVLPLKQCPCRGPIMWTSSKNKYVGRVDTGKYCCRVDSLNKKRLTQACSKNRERPTLCSVLCLLVLTKWWACVGVSSRVAPSGQG